MKTAIYPGSFDPVTYGHIDIIRRASKLFDKVIVVVSVNPLKKTDFSLEERTEFLETVCANMENVEIDSDDGLLVNYFTRKNADVIVKGLREISDFEYEFQMALVNKDMCNKAETIFLCSDVTNTFLSSSLVKQIAMFDGDISAFVPQQLVEKIKERITLRKDNNNAH